MKQENPFDNDWRDCLCAHYIYILNDQDKNNEESLCEVLIASGFTESDIVALRVQTLGAESAYDFEAGETIAGVDEIAPEFPSLLEVPEPIDTTNTLDRLDISGSLMETIVADPIGRDEPFTLDTAEPTETTIEPVDEPMNIQPAPQPSKGKKKSEPPKQMSLF